MPWGSPIPRVYPTERLVVDSPVPAPRGLGTPILRPWGGTCSKFRPAAPTAPSRPLPAAVVTSRGFQDLQTRVTVVPVDPQDPFICGGPLRATAFWRRLLERLGEEVVEVGGGEYPGRGFARGGESLIRETERVRREREAAVFQQAALRAQASLQGLTRAAMGRVRTGNRMLF